MTTYKQLQERINMAKAKMGDVIKDFQDSDAPQFKGKSDEKRRQMAIAAKLSNEEVELEELDENDALKRQIDFVKRDASDKGYSGVRRKAAREKLKSLQSRLKNEEVEELEELSTETLLAYRKKAREADTNKHHVYADEADKKIKKKTGVYNPNLLQRAKAKLRNEEVEQADEGYHVMRNGQSISYHQDKESADKRASASNMRGGSNATVVKDERGVKEELKGDQHKIDANKNGKVDGHDFKLLRAKKK
jgi:alkylated DNA repair dioxygenase AlkB